MRLTLRLSGRLRAGPLQPDVRPRVSAHPEKTLPPENRCQKPHSKSASGSQQDPDQSPNNDRGLVQLKRQVGQPTAACESTNQGHWHNTNEYRSQGPRFGKASQDTAETQCPDNAGHKSSSHEDA